MPALPHRVGPGGLQQQRSQCRPQAVTAMPTDRIGGVRLWSEDEFADLQMQPFIGPT
jgi:hypothetical protein